MPETLIETGRRLEFSTVLPGDVLRVTTGTQGERWQYHLDVTHNTYWPQGVLKTINPHGEIVGPVEDSQFQGCGIWTTPQQNPVQKQARAVTPYFEGLLMQHLLIGKLPDHGRVIFGRTGDEIIHIARVPYRENVILGTLGVYDAAMGARDVTEALTSGTGLDLPEKTVRETLKHLVETGHLRMLKKQTQVFELASSL